MKQAQKTKSTHTQGEWEYFDRPNNTSQRYILTDRDTLICELPKITAFHSTQEELQANAKLIAAAPDLLQALITIVQGCNDDNGFSSLAAIEAIAQQAINKATL